MQIRIDKVLSQLKLATRSESKKMFQSGRIRLNNIVVRNSSAKFDTDRDELYLDGERIIYQEHQYFMLYKPAGCVTATEDAHEKTVMDYLPDRRHQNLAPVGRLDKDTEGLLLITDDGALNHNLLAPGKHVEKTYFARVHGCVTEETIHMFFDGLDIGEKKLTAPARLEILSAGAYSEVYVTITEGKFHQIKRMFQAVDMKVEYLKRISMGTLKLDEALSPGEYRELSEEEVADLKNLI